ncbi:MAG: protein-L-isoaspartate O-methyltransferase family protein, partial [Beijerinckiaceae bacterium]
MPGRLPDLFEDWEAGAETAPRRSPFARTAEDKISLIMRLRDAGYRDTALLRAFELVSRATFAPRRCADLAMRDMALPLPCGQIMTAPLTVARMLAALQVMPHHRVLEIGTGSGYVTALLARMAQEVVTVERYHALQQEAAAKLMGQGIVNIQCLLTDGLTEQGAG